MKTEVKLISITPEAEKQIAYCARVSNPNNQDNPDISKLIKYCYEHKHWSIFEMANMCLEITTSRAIAPQILRHKSFNFQEFCIAGDSIITLKLPSGATYKRSIEHLYRLQARPNGHIKQNGLPLARIFDGEKFTIARIKEVFKTGIKPCFKITLADGKTITCTKEHKFLTRDGFSDLESIVGLSLNNTKAAMSKKGIVATNGGFAYHDKEYLLNLKEESIKNKTGVKGIAEKLNISYHTVRKWLKNNNIQFTPKEVASYTKLWNRGKFGYKLKPHSLETIEKMRKSARRGKDNNLYRGGVERSERMKIADWCGSIRAEKLIEANYECVNCKSNKKLELDHIVSVYASKELAYEKSNIQVLCKKCHLEKHRLNGDTKIWRQMSKGNTLTVKWQTIEKIEYVGEIETYDLEIDNENHNYIANGIVVHNSGRYSDYSSLGEYPFQEIEPRRQDAKNRQNSFDDLDDETKDWFKTNLNNLQQQGLNLYNEALERGIAKESARFFLPPALTSRLYMNGTIRSWIHYLDVRLDPSTQKEHREIAEKAYEIFCKELPIIGEIIQRKK